MSQTSSVTVVLQCLTATVSRAETWYRRALFSLEPRVVAGDALRVH